METYLTIEVQAMIGTLSREAWAAMLGFNEFAAWTLSAQGKAARRSLFRVYEGESFSFSTLGGKLHSAGGTPVFWGNNKEIIVAWMKDGRFHRSDGPAIIHYGLARKTQWKNKIAELKNGNLDVCAFRLKEFYISRGKIHRDDGPAVRYHVGTSYEERYFFTDGFLVGVGEHRERSGVFLEDTKFLSGAECKKSDLPSVLGDNCFIDLRERARNLLRAKIVKNILGLKNPQIVVRAYGAPPRDVCLLFCCDDGPAIDAREEGFYLWAKEGFLHRVGGPALLMNGKEYYYECGARIYADGVKCGKDYHYEDNKKTGGSGNKEFRRGVKVNTLPRMKYLPEGRSNSFYIPRLLRCREAKTIRTKRSENIPFEFGLF